MIEKLVAYFADNYNDLFDKMIECDHGEAGRLNPYHEEGSVWNHTKMVLDAVQDKNDLDVLVSALLHDIGKVYAREVKGDKVCFFGHAGISTFYAIDIVEDIKKNLSGFKWIDVAKILNMINIHDIFFINKTNLSAKDLASKLSGYGSDFVNKLIMLASADNRGRICKNRVDEIDFIEYSNEVLDRVLMSELIKEYGENDYKRNGNNVAIVMVGLPYSGKSTHIQGMSNSNDYAVISRDDIVMSLANGESYNNAWVKVDQQKVNRQLDINLRSAVNNNKNLIIDMTNLSAKSRRGKINMLSDDYTKYAWVFYVGMSELKRRMDIRKDKVINNDVILGMMKQYTIPMFDEFDSISFLYGDGSFQMVNNF
ncbi:MAG: hypothetical protein BWY08_00019 [Bacteroidetes bacterium ADurb.Bin174]|nr:MAG: hypothetical protein BWY08_00019 [Bacteroidetes bacterium ADurb.Bin174]